MAFQVNALNDEATFEDHDLIGRREVSNVLTRIIQSFSRPAVICVDGEWGVGKTHFIKLWMAEAKRTQSARVIYINAFEKDYQKDAFFVVAAGILAAMDAEGGENPERRRRFKETAVKLGRVLLGSALRIGVRIATAGAVNAADGDDVLDALREEVGQEIGVHLSTLLEEGVKQEQTIFEFKAVLREFAASLPALGDGVTKLVIVVDELDRCRPNFALEMIEVLKHLFNESGVHFVLCASISALSSGIEHLYGSGIQGRRYLSRMIDYTISLDVINGDTRSLSRDYIMALWNSHEIRSRDLSGVIELTASLAQFFASSLRDVQRIVEDAALSLVVSGEGANRSDHMIVAFSFLKMHRREVCVRIDRKEITHSDIELLFPRENPLGSGPINHLDRSLTA